jgi:3-deoxy-D-manno-octulosonic-acid transferase
VVEALRVADGIRIVAPEELRATLAALLGDREKAACVGERGRTVFAREAGATARALDVLLALVRRTA